MILDTDTDPYDLDALAAELSDRRRAGRRTATASLIPLLRGSVGPDDESFVADWQPRDPIAPPRGIMLALVLCAPVWMGIGGLLYAFIW